MITSVEIKNFKSIKHKLFELRNLNVLLGLNGMGKSSFIQTLLALRQSDFSNDKLDLKGRYLDLGTSKDVLYQYSKNDIINFCLKFSNAAIVDLDLKCKSEATMLEVLQPTTKLRAEIPHDEPLFNNNLHYLYTNRLEPKSIHNKNPWNVANGDLGMNGEFTAHFIEVHHSKEISFDNLLHKNSATIDKITLEEIINKTLLHQINLWMGEISPEINIKATGIPSDKVLLEYSYKQPNFGTTNHFKPENVGFGISYVLPVVVQLLSAKPGQLLIIENPESHVHPRGQAELGKLIALTAMNDVQIIIETHSDHIVNGIRVAVKEKNLSREKVKLFYFDKKVEPREQYSTVTDIKIDDNGELSQYPQNMLDEWSNQLFKLM